MDLPIIKYSVGIAISVFVQTKTTSEYLSQPE